MVDSKGVTVEFAFERETKRTYRFQEVTDGGEALIGTLYIQQSAFDGKKPEKVTVTVKAG